MTRWVCGEKKRNWMKEWEDNLNLKFLFENEERQEWGWVFGREGQWIYLESGVVEVCRNALILFNTI